MRRSSASRMSAYCAAYSSPRIPVLSRIRDARFKRLVLPGDKVEISVSLTERMGKFFNLTGEIRNKDKVSLTISFALALVKSEGN